MDFPDLSKRVKAFGRVIEFSLNSEIAYICPTRKQSKNSVETP